MISYDEALERMLECVKPLGTESVMLDEADGRYLARPVIASFSSPAELVSAMDGYAVHDCDVAHAPIHLEIIGKSFAGDGYFGDLPRGTCVHVFTGAPVPAGADRVVIQENTRVDGSNAFFDEVPDSRRHLRSAGSDFRVGDELIGSGRQLNAQRLVTAAAADMSELEVVRRPRVFIASTGTELSEPGQSKSRPGSIPESNSFGVAALARRWGAEVVGRARSPDVLETLQATAQNAAEDADVIVVIGGASVGEKDFAKEMFAPLGLELVFDKVAMKPGKPVWMGRLGDRPVLGLPGNPASALITARLLLAPLLTVAAGGEAATALAWHDMPIMSPVDSGATWETFLRAKRNSGGVMILPNQDSAAQKSIGECDLLVRRRIGAPSAQAGALVEVLVF